MKIIENNQITSIINALSPFFGQAVTLKCNSPVIFNYTGTFNLSVASQDTEEAVFVVTSPNGPEMTFCASNIRKVWFQLSGIPTIALR